MNQTTGGSSRYGYGLTGEFRISNHWAVDVNALYRRIGYQFDQSITTTTTVILNGVTSSNTSTTSSHEDTRARLFDFPFVVRWYTSAKRPNGPRLFAEGGGAYRFASGIRTSIDTTDAADNLTCCTNTPATPANKSSLGIVAGVGLLLIDPFGIHVVPEIRYTRWTDQTFNNMMTVTTEQNQLEAVFSLSF